MMRRLQIAFLVLVLLPLVIVAAVSVSAEAAGPCEDQAGVNRLGESLDGSTPVVLVHGFTGSERTWFRNIDVTIDDDVPPLDRSFVEQLMRIDTVSIWTFEYSDVSARWVTDPLIGPPRADRLTCSAHNGGQPAVIVAHSMGGSAARYAISLLKDSAIVSGLVTFGTPNLGSDVAAWASGALDGAELYATASSPLGAAAATLLRSALDRCDADKTFSVDDTNCPLVGALPPLGSEAALSMRRNSTAVNSLPNVPDHVSTLAIAGQIEVAFQASAFGFFYQDIGILDVGDLMVMVDSATAGSDVQWVRSCRLNVKAGYAVSDDIMEFTFGRYDDGKEQGITKLFSSGCFHSNLTRTVEFANDALFFINSIVEEQSANTVIRFGVGIGRCRLGEAVEGCIEEFSEYPANNVAYGYWFGHILAIQEGGGGNVEYIEFWPPTSGDAALAHGPHFSAAAWTLPPEWFVNTLGQPTEILRQQSNGEISQLVYPGATIDFRNGELFILTLHEAAEPDSGKRTLDLSFYPYADRITSGAPAIPVSASTPLTINRMGGITVGMTLDEAGSGTGQQLASDFLDGYCYSAWIPGVDGLGLRMSGYGPGFSPNSGMVSALSVWDSAFETEFGISVGSSEAELVGRLGDRLVASPHEYDPNGTYYDLASDKPSPQPLMMRFTVEDGTVVTISAGYEDWATLTEGCS